MNTENSLSDPDMPITCQVLGTDDCFEVKVPSRARVKWLRTDIAKELATLPVSLDDMKLVYCGRVLDDSDVVGRTINQVHIECVLCRKRLLIRDFLLLFSGKRCCCCCCSGTTSRCLFRL